MNDEIGSEIEPRYILIPDRHAGGYRWWHNPKYVEPPPSFWRRVWLWLWRK